MFRYRFLVIIRQQRSNSTILRVLRIYINNTQVQANHWINSYHKYLSSTLFMTLCLETNILIRPTKQIVPPTLYCTLYITQTSKASRKLTIVNLDQFKNYILLSTTICANINIEFTRFTTKAHIRFTEL